MIYDFNALAGAFAKLESDTPKKTSQMLNRYKRIFVYGAGRSGLMLKAFAMRLAQAGKTVYAVGETVTPAIEKGDLLILASASGTTQSVCRYAQVAKDLGASVFAITATENSPLAMSADSIIVFTAPTKDNPHGASVMGTVFEQSLLLFLDLTVENLGVDFAKMRQSHANLE